MASFHVRAIPATVGAGRNYFYDDDDGTTHELTIDQQTSPSSMSGQSIPPPKLPKQRPGAAP
jgi:hypothetical protein